MKFVLMLVVAFAAWWLIRRSLRDLTRPRATKADPAAPATPETIVACRHCGLHLPAVDALPGRDGVFCDAAHRAAYEAAHPHS